METYRKPANSYGNQLIPKIIFFTIDQEQRPTMCVSSLASAVNKIGPTHGLRSPHSKHLPGQLHGYDTAGFFCTPLKAAYFSKCPVSPPAIMSLCLRT